MRTKNLQFRKEVKSKILSFLTKTHVDTCTAIALGINENPNTTKELLLELLNEKKIKTVNSRKRVYYMMGILKR